MKASELLKYLQNSIIRNGDCEIFIWDNINMKNIPVNSIKYIKQRNYNKDLGNVSNEYNENFHKILNNIIIE